MSILLQEALTQLATLTNNGRIATQQELRNLASQVSVYAEGGVTVLYSGALEDGVSAGDVVKEMASNDSNLRVISNTAAAEFLNDDNFKKAITDSFGLSIDAIDNPESAAYRFLEDTDGLWGDTSTRFVQETTGEVRIMTLSPNESRILYQRELPALIDRLNSGAITNVDGLTREGILSIGTSYTNPENKLNALRNSLINSAITQTHFSNPSISNYSDFIDLTPEKLSTAMSHATPDSEAKWLQYLSHFEVPPAATRVLNKLGPIAALVGFGLATIQAGAAEANGDTEGAKAIIKDYALDTAGSLAGEIVAGAIAGLGAAALVAGGIISAPVAGAIVISAALIGGFFGGDGAKQLYDLMHDHDDNGKLDIIDKLGNLLFGANYTLTSPLPADLNGDKLTLDATFSREEIVANAKTDIAWRYALRELNSFVIPDISYDQHNADGSLDVYDPVTGQGSMTELYMADRAAMLTWKIRYDTGALDDNDSPHTGPKPYNDEWDTNTVQGNYDFIDMSLKLNGGAPLTLSIDGVGLSLYDHQIIFGSKDGETLQGSGDSDHLYGMAGNDTLNGDKGTDWLEGGTGTDSLNGGEGADSLYGGADNDTLSGGVGDDFLYGGTGTDTYIHLKGDGNDVITDSDGLGQIKIDNDQILTGGTKITGNSNLWQSDDKKTRYSLYDNGDGTQTLNIYTGSERLYIKNFTNGNLGIQLEDPTPASPPPTYSSAAANVSTEWDLNTHSAIYSQANIQTTYAVGTNGEVTGRGILIGNASNNMLHSMGGDSTMQGGEGNDMLWGDGDGNHDLSGDGGNDVLYGGIADDILNGGTGDDNEWRLAA